MRAVILAALLSTTASADTICKVTDGDSLRMAKGACNGETYSVRIWGIDAPELRQPYGREAKRTMGELLSSASRLSLQCVDTDRYGREVCRVSAGDVDLGLEMVKLGAAHWYERYAKEALEYRRAEATARADRRGLWATPGAMRPWDWRRAK